MVVRKRLDIAGPAVAFITTTTFEWKPVLTPKSVAEIIISALLKTQSLFAVTIIAYVLMPSHVHLLFGFQNIEYLSRCIQSFKSITSRQTKEMMLPELAMNDYKLWKPRFDDLIIQSEKQLRIKMEYIHNNPVKAGLVRRAEDWLYSSAVDWLTTRKGLIDIDKEYHWLTT
jgi:putative transposase